MKRILKLAVYGIVAIPLLASCQKDEPNEITIAAMKEAMTGEGEALDLSKWNEFIASL